MCRNSEAFHLIHETRYTVDADRFVKIYVNKYNCDNIEIAHADGKINTVTADHLCEQWESNRFNADRHEHYDDSIIDNAQLEWI